MGQGRFLRWVRLEKVIKVCSLKFQRIPLTDLQDFILFLYARNKNCILKTGWHL